MSRTYNWLHRVWYQNSPSGLVLLPLSALYWLIQGVRRLLYRCGILTVERASVPVIVVGNITAGGTGKTPTVIWLIDGLRARGFSPGIISRGYGGSHSGSSMRVDADTDPSVAGDEPVLLARRARCPVAVDNDRLRASAMLVEDGVDVIVSDDGLQHTRLHRDYEICVVDGARGFGNGRLIPAGPLRESRDRLSAIDQLLVNGADMPGAMRFDLHASDARRIDNSLARPLTAFKDVTVHAVAGIGNPQRFFDMLRTFGIQVIEHALQDHAELSKEDLSFGDNFDVFMTEKDVVKLRSGLSDKYWYVAVDFAMKDTEAEALLNDIVERIESKKDAR